MAKEIRLSVTGDTQGLVDAVKKGAVAVEKLEDVLGDTGDAGKDSGRDIERGMENAQDNTQKLKKEIGQARDAFDKAGRAGRDLGDNVKYGTDKATDGVKDIGREAESTAKESAASFDGSAESIGDAFQEVAANAFAGFGPAGAIAGIAAAAGIGLVFSKIEEGSANTEEAKAKVQELAQEFIDAGGVGEASIEFMVDKLKELATVSEDGEDSLKSLRKVADDAGRSYEDLAQAYAGNIELLDDLIDSEKDYLDTLILESNIDLTENSGREGKAIQDKIDKQQAYIDLLDKAKGSADDAAEAEQNYIDSGAAALEARGEQADTLQDILDDSISGFEDYKNAETGAFDPAAYIAGMEARRVATTNFNANVQSIGTQFGLTSDEVQGLLDQGLDFAGPLQSIIDSGLAGEFAAQVRAGSDAGQNILDGTTLTSTVEVDTDLTLAERGLTALQKAPRATEKVKVEADTKPADTAINTFTGKNRKTVVDVDVNLALAETKLRNFLGRSRSINVEVRATSRDGQRVI